MLTKEIYEMLLPEAVKTYFLLNVVNMRPEENCIEQHVRCCIRNI